MLGSEELSRRISLGARGSQDGIVVVPSVVAPGASEVSSAASIDLRLGRWFLALQQTRTSEIDLTVDRSSEDFEAREGRMNYVAFGRKFVIHPGRFVLAATLEWLRLPASVGGFITGKSTIGRRGLVIETAAGLHPGFSGCITLELANCGEVPIAIVPGMKICQVFFHAIEGGGSASSTKFGGRRRPTFGPYQVDTFVKSAITAHGDHDGQTQLPFGNGS